MNDYKNAMQQAEMPADCEARIRGMLLLGKKRQNRSVGKRIVRMATAAAAAILLLMGGALAVSGGWSDLVDIFRERSGGVYTETQIAQLTELEEDVGLSAESGGITVTVDSVLTGDHSVDVLLRVSGAAIEWNEEWNYGFYNFRFRLNNSLKEENPQYYPEGVFASDTYYSEYLGFDAVTGEAMVLFHYEGSDSPYFLWRDGDHSLALELDRFYAYGDSRGDERAIYQGEWEIVIPLAEFSESNIIHLGETEVLVKTEELREGEYDTRPFVETELVVEDIWITATTVCVEYAESDDSRGKFARFFDFRIIMKDGSIIEDGGIGGGWYHDGMVITAHTWKESIDLAAIDCIEQNGQIIWHAE